MVKISALFLMAFLLIGTLSFVVAAEESDAIIPEAKKVGFFENSFDNMRFAFTFNKEKKIELALSLAEKRLAEAEAMAEENPEKAEKAQERYDNFVAKAEGILANIEESKDGVNGSAEDMSKIVRIQNKFEKHKEHTEMIYTRALKRFEENNASDEKVERFEGLYEKAMNRSDDMEAKLLDRRENAEKKHKVLANMSDEELEELLTDIEEKEGLAEAREIRTERAEVRNEEVAQIRERSVERAKLELKGLNLTGGQKMEINNRIGVVSQRMIEAERLLSRDSQAGVSPRNLEEAKEAIEAELNNRRGQ